MLSLHVGQHQLQHLVPGARGPSALALEPLASLQDGQQVQQAQQHCLVWGQMGSLSSCSLQKQQIPTLWPPTAELSASNPFPACLEWSRRQELFPLGCFPGISRVTLSHRLVTACLGYDREQAEPPATAPGHLERECSRPTWMRGASRE